MSATLDRPASAGTSVVRPASSLDFDRSTTGYDFDRLEDDTRFSLTDDEPPRFYWLPIHLCAEPAITTAPHTYDLHSSHGSWLPPRAQLEPLAYKRASLRPLRHQRMRLHIRRTTLGDPRSAGLSPALAPLAAEIEASRSLLGLENDWDGDGSPGYDEMTWQRAVDFVVRNASRLYDEYGVVVEGPKIRKGPQGSIDLHWRTPTRELLVNVPAATGQPADYYGDNGAGGQQIKGTLDPAGQGYHLMLWLVS